MPNLLSTQTGGSTTPSTISSPSFNFGTSGNPTGRVALLGSPYSQLNLSSPSLGVKAASPTLNTTTPTNTIKSTYQAPASQVGTPLPGGGYAVPGVGTVGTPTNSATVPTTGGTSGTSTATPTASLPGLLNSLSTGTTQSTPFVNQTATALANTSAAGSPAATQYASQTAQYGAGNLPIEQQAEGIANQYGQNISNAENQAGTQYAGFMTGGGGPIGLGRAGAVQNALSQYVTGQSAAEQAALQGTAQALTGQNQAANASAAAGGLANTQQANIQSGLASAGNIGVTSQGQQLGAAGTAASLAPQALQYGAFGASNLSPSSYLPSLAQQVQQGLISPADANSIANSIYGSAGSTMLNQQLQGSGFNYNTAAGNSAAQQSVAQTGGTAVQQSNVGVLNNAQQNYANYTNLANNITSLGNQAISALSQSGINPTDSRYANMTINQVLSQFNGPQYAQLNAAIQGLQTRVSALINTGQDLGTATQASTSIVNGGMTLGSLTASLNQINQEAGAIVSNQGQIVQSAQSAIQGGSGSSGATGSSTSAPNSVIIDGINYGW